MYLWGMETFTAPKSGDTLTVDTDHIEVETDNAEVSFPVEEDAKVAIALALLGEAPPLGEAYGTPEDMAKDKSLSDGEIRYRAIASLAALELRHQEILRKTKEQEERDKKARAEARKRLKQINALEAAYLATQTGRRQQSTQASQNIAEAMYNAGVRVVPPSEDKDEESTED